MPAAYSALQLIFKFTSLSPVVDNPSFHLTYGTANTTQDLTDVQDLANHIIASINAIPTGAASAPNAYVSAAMSRASNMGMLDVYDISNVLSSGREGSPIAVTSFTLGGSPTAQVMPEGVCSVITLQAPYGTDVEFGPGTRPRARDRGRIYFGPLTNGAMTNEVTTNRTIMATAAITTLTKWMAAISVYTTGPHSIVYNLSVWSRKNGFLKKAQEAWVDDRPDYQRRRTDQGVNRTIQALP